MASLGSVVPDASALECASPLPGGPSRRSSQNRHAAVSYATADQDAALEISSIYIIIRCPPMTTATSSLKPSWQAEVEWRTRSYPTDELAGEVEIEDAADRKRVAAADGRVAQGQHRV